MAASACRKTQIRPYTPPQPPIVSDSIWTKLDAITVRTIPYGEIPIYYGGYPYHDSSRAIEITFTYKVFSTFSFDFHISNGHVIGQAPIFDDPAGYEYIRFAESAAIIAASTNQNPAWSQLQTKLVIAKNAYQPAQSFPVWIQALTVWVDGYPWDVPTGFYKTVTF
jgi:hypothetical protein